MIYKSHNHAYYKIEDGLLYEAYTTIRGPRFRAIGRLKYPYLSDESTIHPL